jgi:hypothetical protein
MKIGMLYLSQFFLVMSHEMTSVVENKSLSDLVAAESSGQRKQISSSPSVLLNSYPPSLAGLGGIPVS